MHRPWLPAPFMVRDASGTGRVTEYGDCVFELVGDESSPGSMGSLVAALAFGHSDVFHKLQAWRSAAKVQATRRVVAQPCPWATRCLAAQRWPESRNSSF